MSGLSCGGVAPENPDQRLSGLEGAYGGPVSGLRCPSFGLDVGLESPVPAPALDYSF